MIARLTVALGIAVIATLLLGLAQPRVSHERDVRAALDAYVATASIPGGTEVNPELFAEDIEAFWSGGDTYIGRDLIVEMLEESKAQSQRVFRQFSVTAEDVHEHVGDDMAWIRCHLEIEGVFLDGSTFARTVRSTFIFEREGDRWVMTHEHSSRLGEDRRTPAPDSTSPERKLGSRSPTR